MKITLIVAIALLSLAVVLAGCTKAENSGANDKTMMEKTAMAEKEGMEKKAMQDKEASEMTEEGFELEHGTMMMIDAKTNKTSVMDKEMELNDGTKVMTDGKVSRTNGTSFMLHEGESIWMDGTFMRAGEMMEASGSENSAGMMKDEYVGAVLAGTITPYIDYTKEDYDKALAENKVIVLNFYANWCPICKTEQPEAFVAFNELKKPNVIGFRVHFKDSEVTADETALAQQFGVPYQHTKVIVKDGKKVLKAPDSWDKERYISEISKYA